MDCEAEGPPTSIISPAECDLSQVIFMNVQQFYKPNTDIQCTFCREENFASRSKDWIGIFKVGWKTTREYFTWISARTSVDDTVLFKAYFLPKDDDYYQFCYVDYKGEARGASIPFQFSYNIPEDDDILVVINEKILKNLTKENTQLQEKVSSLKNETQAQAERIQNLQDELLRSSTKMQWLERENMSKMEAERTVRQLKTHLQSAEETMQVLERQLAQQKDISRQQGEEVLTLRSALELIQEDLKGVHKNYRIEIDELHSHLLARDLNTSMPSNPGFNFTRIVYRILSMEFTRPVPVHCRPLFVVRSTVWIIHKLYKQTAIESFNMSYMF